MPKLICLVTLCLLGAGCVAVGAYGFILERAYWPVWLVASLIALGGAMVLEDEG
jgi:hypothetical protein